MSVPHDPEVRCGFEWPQTPEEKQRRLSDCPHCCGLPQRHEGDHRCPDGATHAR